MSEKKWVHRRYEYIGTEMVDELISYLQKTRTRATREGWRNLRVEIQDSGDGYYDGSPSIYLTGERLEDDEEFKKRLEQEEKDTKRREEFERKQYEALKAKYG